MSSLICICNQYLWRVLYFVFGDFFFQLFSSLVITFGRMQYFVYRNKRLVTNAFRCLFFRWCLLFDALRPWIVVSVVLSGLFLHWILAIHIRTIENQVLKKWVNGIYMRKGRSFYNNCISIGYHFLSNSLPSSE